MDPVNLVDPAPLRAYFLAGEQLGYLKRKGRRDGLTAFVQTKKMHKKVAEGVILPDEWLALIPELLATHTSEQLDTMANGPTH
jgi:hypothetical protein